MTMTPKPLRPGRVLRVLCMALALLLLSGLAGAYAETPAEKYNRLKKELEETRGNIKALENSIASNEQRLAEYQREKEILDEMIVVKEQDIDATEADLVQKNAELSNKLQSIYDNDQLLRQRLVAIYTMNNSSAMSQLFNVESFGDLTRLLDSMRRISKHDTDLLDLLESQRAGLETEREAIDAQLVQLRADYEELLLRQEEKRLNIEATAANLNYAQSQKEASEELEEEQMAALAAAQEEMRRISSGIGGSRKGDGSEYIGGVFGWPVPGHFNITCHFGAPDPNGQPHRGLDIGAPTGTPIAACGNGTVIIASEAGASYGTYIVIDHGDGVKTLYAHCSALYVGVGTGVVAGDIIGAVGTTGFVTGPHLHLEVQTPGLENPLNWLKG